MILELQFAEESVIQKDSIENENIHFVGKRVLLAEDNDFNREIAHFVLQNIGFCILGYTKEAKDKTVIQDERVFWV